MKVSHVGVLAVILSAVSAHKWDMGSCPRVDPFPNLSVDKFLGLWYVIRQVDTTASCLKFNYTRVSPTELRVTKLREFAAMRNAGLDVANSYAGTLDIPDGANPSVMRVKWPLNFFGKGDYFIFDTDYEHYAGVFDCQTVTRFFHRYSAAILSRTPTLSKEYMERVNRRLRTFGIDPSDLDAINHNGCSEASEADINVNFDEDTLGNFFSDAVDNVQKVFVDAVGNSDSGKKPEDLITSFEPDAEEI